MHGRPTHDGKCSSGLTFRQRQVLGLVLQQKTAKEIARELTISPHTVEQRIRLAKEKLRVTRRSELVAAYLRTNGTYGKTVYDESRIARGIPDQSQADWKGVHSFQAGIEAPIASAGLKAGGSPCVFGTCDTQELWMVLGCALEAPFVTRKAAGGRRTGEVC